MLIDTHTHLLDEHYEHYSVEEIIKKASLNDVNYLVLGSTDREDNIFNERIANEFPNVFFTCGYHPDSCFDYNISLLEEIIIRSDKLLGIGEIGLDFHYGKENEKEQIELFEKQLSLAEKYNLPVVIHTRDAFLPTYQILSKYNVNGIIHCFSGSLEVAKQFIEQGFYLGIGGVVAFKGCNLIDVIRDVGVEHIVFETDSPYLSPFRGEINFSSNVKYIAKFISEKLNVDYDLLTKIVNDNTKKIFPRLNDKI